MKRLSTLFLVAISINSFSQNPLLLKDVAAGNNSSTVQQIVKTTNYTFFNENDGGAATDRSLYRTDGTPAGTIKLNLTYPTYTSTKADKLTALGNKVVFAGDNIASYGEIWASDGTQAGTVALERFQPISNRIPVVEISAMGSYAYYSVINKDAGGINRAYLRRTDGTAAGTSLVYDFSAFTGVPEVVFLTPVNNILYFIVYDAGGTGVDQLWRSDGTNAGTYMVYNFTLANFVESYIMPAGDNMYIMIGSIAGGVRQNTIWKSDGTAAGTVPVKFIGTGNTNLYPSFVAIGSTLYFAGADGNGKELWKTDGTAAGTMMVNDINPGVASSNPINLTILNNTLYFSATTAAAGNELWRSNGTSTTLVKDIYPGTASSNPAVIVESNGSLLFRAANDPTGSELWISDGTAANTKMVVDLNASGASNPNLLTPGNPVYFTANNGTNGVEVFKYNNSGSILDIHTKLYVNDNVTSGDVFTTAIGNNANAGTKAAPVATLSYAISIAQAGDTIIVDAGTYVGQVLIDKAITIRGAGIGATIINPGNEPPATLPGIPPAVLYSTFGIGDVFINNLTINSGTPSSAGVQYYGISLQTGGGITGCEINGAGTSSSNGQGIYINKDDVDPETISILNNHLHNIGFLSIKINVPHITAIVNNNTIDVTGSVYGMGLVAGGEPHLIDGLEFIGNKIIGITGFGVKVNCSSSNVTISNNSFEKGVNEFSTSPFIQNTGMNPINASCNWFGSTDAEIVRSRIQGYNVGYSPWLSNGTDESIAFGFQTSAGFCNGRQNKFYVNNNSQTGDVFTTAVGNNSNNGFSSAPFATINYAISVAQAGDTIIVDAGTYTERIFVSKPLYFKGAYGGVDPGTLLNRGVSETILLPSTENNLLEIITVQTANVSFDGFLFDGDNPAITGTTMLNGIDVNAGMGISNGNLPTDNLVVKNNIFRNFFRYGVFLQKTTGTVTGNVISRNHIDNVPSRTPRDGRAVGLFNNVYAAVTDNHITRVNTGVLVANMNVGSTDSILIASNTVDAYSYGINVNVNTNLTSPIVINNNQLTVSNFAAWSAPGSAAVNNCTGINISGLTISKKVSITNNTVTGTRFGVGVSQLNSSDKVFLSNNIVTGAETGITFSSIVTPQGIEVNGGTVSNSSSLGLFYINSDAGAAKLKLNNVSLVNNLVGLDASAADDNTMQLEFAGVTINGGTTGIRFYGKPISLPANKLSGISFLNQSKEYILQTSHSLENQTIDASTVSFDGVTPGNMTLAQLFATEDKLTHRTDFDGVGYFKLKPNEVFVTPNSFAPTMPAVWGVATTAPDINRGVAAAAEGDIIHIAAGTYANQITIDKGVTIIGEGKDATFIVPPALPYSAPPGPFTERGLIQTTQNIGDVHILDLSATGDFSNGLQGIVLQSGGSVKNCKVLNGSQGIFFRVESAIKTAVVENNIINAAYIATNFQGSGLTASLINNTITVSDPGFSSGIFAGLDFGPLPMFTATGNLISGFAHSGFFGGSLNATITQNSFVGTGPAIWQLSGSQIQANCNWYGTGSAQLVQPKISGNVNYGPWLIDGTDNSPAVGFQNSATCPVANSFYVNDNSQSGDIFTTAVGNDANSGTFNSPFATLSYAISQVPVGATVYVDAGTYITANITLDKSITILGTNYQVSPNNITDPLVYNSSRNAESIISNSQITLAADDINVEGLTFNTPSNNQFVLSSTAVTNNLCNNIKLEKNRFVSSTSALNVMVLNGKAVSPATTNNFLIHDNRMENATGAYMRIDNFNNFTITKNSFIRTVVSPSPVAIRQNAGRIENLTVEENVFQFWDATVFTGSAAVKNLIYNSNKAYNTLRGVQFNPGPTEPITLTITNNVFQQHSTAGSFPSLFISRNSALNAATPNSIRIEANTFTYDGTGQVIIPQSLVNVICNNNSTSGDPLSSNYQLTFRKNILNYTGNLSGSSNLIPHGLRLEGKLSVANIDSNEITYTGINLPIAPATEILKSSGIFVGNTPAIPIGAMLNINNNKVHGFKQSVAFYNGAQYGGISSGVIANINNNSFSSDLISINNGSTSATLNATCNWYGSVAAQDVLSKITTATVNSAPWLTNGTDTDIATGFQPVPGSCTGTPVVATLNTPTNISCFGANNGAITITISGGTGPYVIEWSKDGDTYSSDEDLTNLSPGTYGVTVTDANGSIASISDIVTSEPLLLTASASGSNVSCFNGSNGSASVTAQGGTAPYTYQWSNGGTTEDISGVIAGNYSVTITDVNGCTANSSYIVTQPTLLTAVATGTSTTCANSATVVASGGTMPYTYLWSNGAGTQSITSLPAGIHTVTVTDAQGCQTTANCTVSATEAFNPSASVTNVSCFGGNDGSITVTNVNGVAPFQYSLDGVSFQSGNTFPGLVAGTYTITVKDVNGCTGFVEKTITQPLLLTLILETIQSTCYGQSTGAVSITVTGGSGSVGYSWSGPSGYTSTQKNISGLAAGSYSLIVTDGNGCTKTLNLTVPTFNVINVTPVVTNIACKGEVNGSISVAVTGGSGSGFSYLWNTGATANNISTLSAGNYSVTIIDISTGCSVARSFTITQPASLVNLSTTKTNGTGCASLGTITATGTGGTAGYQYKLDNGNYQPSGTFTGLYAGNYTVWVKDANGCTKSNVVSITDNGSDEYEGNNSKNQAKAINVDADVFARIAISTDVADWFKFTTTISGNYTITLSHPSASFTFNLYAAGNNAPALVPGNTTPTSKQYTLAANTTYYVSITGGLSYQCYKLNAASSQLLTRSSQQQSSVSETPVDLFEIKVLGNPSANYFNIAVNSSSNEKMTLRVLDVSGRIIEQKGNLSAAQVIKIGANYHSGAYFAEIMQGNNRKTVQLIKL